MLSIRKTAVTVLTIVAFGAGWLYKVKVASAGEKDALLGPSEYEALVAEGAH